MKKGYINTEEYFVDGTKIETNANKYTFVWKKAYDKIQKQLDYKYTTDCFCTLTKHIKFNVNMLLCVPCNYRVYQHLLKIPIRTLQPMTFLFEYYQTN